MRASVCDLNLHNHTRTLVFQRYYDSSVCVRVSVCDLDCVCVCAYECV